MTGWIIGMLGVSFAGCTIASAYVNVKVKHDYQKKLEKAKAGKTIIRAGKTSGEVYTFDSEQEALKYPQEITFTPSIISSESIETVLSIDSQKKAIELFDGKKFITISDTQIVPVVVDGNTTYVYLRLVEH